MIPLQQASRKELQPSPHHYEFLPSPESAVKSRHNIYRSTQVGYLITIYCVFTLKTKVLLRKILMEIPQLYFLTHLPQERLSPREVPTPRDAPDQLNTISSKSTSPGVRSPGEVIVVAFLRFLSSNITWCRKGCRFRGNPCGRTF